MRGLVGTVSGTTVTFEPEIGLSDGAAYHVNTVPVSGGNVAAIVNMGQTTPTDAAVVQMAASNITDTNFLGLAAGGGTGVGLVIDSSNNVGIGTTSPQAKLHVEGNITGSGNIDINGTLTINNVLLDNQQNIDVDTGTETIATIDDANTAVFFDYSISDNTNFRAGTVTCTHNGSGVVFTENSTADIGDTSGVELSVELSGGNILLKATVDSDNWIIKTLIRAIQ